MDSSDRDCIVLTVLDNGSFGARRPRKSRNLKGSKFLADTMRTPNESVYRAVPMIYRAQPTFDAVVYFVCSHKRARMKDLIRLLLTVVGPFCILCFGTTSKNVFGQNSTQSLWHLTGRVVSEGGKPLSGVSVGPGAVTDAGGYYILELPAPGLHYYRVRFSLAGFHPLTRAADPQTHQLDVVLQSGENSWTPPKCSSMGKSKVLGWLIKISVPDNVTIKETTYDDYTNYEIFFGKEESGPRMSFVSGLLIGFPWPSKEQLQSSSFINERSMACGFGMDYRGKDKDGSMWRVTGVFSEVIRYNKVPDQAAWFFDTIIDSLCCNAPPN